MKKFISIVFVLALVVSSALNVSAVETREQFSGIYINMPYITAELSGDDYEDCDASSVTAALDDEVLTVNGLHKYNSEVDTVKAYLLVDISQSAAGYLTNIKKYINEYISQMSKNDEIVIITFGTEVKTIFSGKKEDKELSGVIDSIECNDEYTMLYDALNDAYQSAVSSVDDFTRTYAIAFTDCKNDGLVSISEDEVSKEYYTHQLPLYVSAPLNSDSEDIEVLGKIARLSGGGIDTVESSEDFSEFKSKIDNVEILELEASDSAANGEEKNLSVLIKSKSLNANITVSKSTSDTVVPKAETCTYDSKNNAFLITFSEKVKDLTDEASYSVADGDGKKWEVSSAEAQSEDDEVQLVMKDNIVNGDYTISFNGITDCSQEKNAIEDSVNVTVSDAEPAAEEDNNDTSFVLITAIIIGAAVVVLIIVIFTVILISRRKTSDSDIINDCVPRQSQFIQNSYETNDIKSEKHHIKIDSGIRVRINIKTGNLSEQNIEMGIISSITVGRSSVCDIYIDDPKLSRQHFIIEQTDKELYVLDLGSKNGTFVNGIRVKGKRKILNDDKIFAGLSEITIHFA